MASDKTALVVSAHAADFVWHAGGAIALHQQLGYAVTVVCLSRPPAEVTVSLAARVRAAGPGGP